MTPLLTLFTAPKPFQDPHIDMIQRNTLRNWQALGEDVAIVVIGDEPGIAEACREYGIRHLPDVATNEKGTPLISSIFDLGRSINDSPYLAYANGDILFLPDLVQAVRRLAEVGRPFLAVGQRFDLDVTQPLSFDNDWADDLHQRVMDQGKLHGQTGSDYFIYPRDCFRSIPDFTVGRAGWDNWMLYRARWMNWVLVDATPSVTVVHQNHDYSHLPGGVIHFYQPETDENVKLAGGRRAIFKLTDARYTLDKDGLKRDPLTWQSFWREVEIFPLVRLHSKVLGSIAFAIFHPVRAFNEIKGWLAYKFGRQ
ncbi:hypothetical protein KQH50_00255 [bacterium]|nr:hypothetical protein [bacterium]